MNECAPTHGYSMFICAHALIQQTPYIRIEIVHIYKQLMYICTYIYYMYAIYVHITT